MLRKLFLLCTLFASESSIDKELPFHLFPSQVVEKGDFLTLLLRNNASNRSFELTYGEREPLPSWSSYDRHGGLLHLTTEFAEIKEHFFLLQTQQENFSIHHPLSIQVVPPNQLKEESVSFGEILLESFGLSCGAGIAAGTLVLCILSVNATCNRSNCESCFVRERRLQREAGKLHQMEAGIGTFEKYQ